MIEMANQIYKGGLYFFTDIATKHEFQHDASVFNGESVQKVLAKYFIFDNCLIIAMLNDQSQYPLMKTT